MICDTLLLAAVFNNFLNMRREIYGLDPAHFFFLFVFFALGLAWQAAFKKTKVKLDTLTDIDMLFMIQKGIRGGIYQAVH